MRQPHHYTRRVLLVIIGRTPQIFTETLYKLAVESTPAFVPTEIHIITTQEGAKSAELALLGVDSGGGEFHRFCADFDFHNIYFDSQNIHIIADTEGEFIDDNQSSAHNRVASDFITQKVQEFTRDEQSILHLSLAGGRKTMSFYAGYALSLYGRMQDRLSHVLVNDPFQNNLDFFYPRPTPQRIKIGNTYHSTAEARIILSDIPYVRMRYHVPEALLAGKAGFQETVEAIQRFARPETIDIDITKKEVRLNGIKVEMSDADLALYLWMCERRKRKEHPFLPDADAFVEDYIEVYTRVVGQLSGMIDRLEIVARKRTAKQQKDWFQQRKSKLKKAIDRALGKRPARPFLIQTTEYKGQIAYEIKMKSRAITIQ